MLAKRVVVVGGGAAGFFAAITAAEKSPAPALHVVVLEKAARFLGKVRISGGGRCNVTHAEFDPRRFVESYPRGSRELLGPFHRFQARDTVEWFRSRDVALKTEPDGRMFPTTDSSETIVECLMRAARDAGVELHARSEVLSIRRRGSGGFLVGLADGSTRECDAVVLTTGGTRAARGARIAASLGHTLEEAVPSLFAFDIGSNWLRELAGVSVPDVEVSLPGTKRSARGPILITHKGLSGPAILRLSAWGARELSAQRHAGTLQVDFLPGMPDARLRETLAAQAAGAARRAVANTPLFGLPARLWSALATAAGVAPGTRWTGLSRADARRLSDHLRRLALPIVGKSPNKEEFVTCGGVRLREVDFRTMESRVCPGLYLAGEILDIDALTGGFNFQSAWTTGWLAGTACAATAGVTGP